MAGKILAMFAAAGRARTKGSLRPVLTPGRRGVHMIEQTKDSGLWRARLAKACQVNQMECWGSLLGHGGAVEVRYAVYLPRILSVAQGAAQGAVIPSHEQAWPIDRMLGDTDKFQRNLGDALQDSKLILDDAQIVDWMCGKRWASGGTGHVEVMVCEAERPEDGPWWMPSR